MEDEATAIDALATAAAERAMELYRGQIPESDWQALVAEMADVIATHPETRPLLHAMMPRQQAYSGIVKKRGAEDDEPSELTG